MTTYGPERWDVGKWDQSHWDGQRGLNIAAGSIVLTGTVVTLRLKRSYILAAVPGSIVVTRNPANLIAKHNYILSVVTSAIALSGKTAKLPVARRLPAIAGAITLAGSAVVLRLARAPLSAQTGSIVVTSRAAALPSKRTLAATPGTVSLTGFAAGLSTSTGKQLIAVPGAVLLNGTLANLVTGRKLRFVADAGTLLLTGQPIAFSRAVHAIILSRGAVVTGSDIDLIHGAVSGNTLLAEPGTIALSGQLASLRVGHVLPPDLPPPGVFVPTRRAFIPNRW